MGRHGFQPQGYINPIVLARANPQKNFGGPTLKDYLARPRPSLNDIKAKLAESDKSAKDMEEWDEETRLKHRAMLAKDR